ncbi:MAG: Mrp/NBP35 family ATP-binding protein [Clostridia bacterium]
MKEQPHELSEIKKVIGVISGKGGVGKSLVTALLAMEANRQGYRTALLDADITGPSIPRAFGITEKAGAGELGMFPVETRTGIRLMSVNLLLEKESDPVVWRGPILSGTVKQFWTEVIWGEIDLMLIDMPPGTGDVPLTIFQSLPVDGIVIVSSPQELVGMIVSKAVKMARMMDIPILGLVENFSYFKCPGCGEIYHLFGESRLEQMAKELGLPLLGRIPVDPEISRACDNGDMEQIRVDWLEMAVRKLMEGVEQHENSGGK